MATDKELRVVDTPRTESSAIMQIIERASTSPDFDIDKLTKLLELKIAYEKDEARKAYNAAIAAFKAEAPKIVKNRHVKFQTQKGTTEYHHATLGEVVTKSTAILSKFGLSHSWDVNQTSGIEVTCKVSHVLGHSETVTMKAEADDSGGKNKIQQIGSTVSYLQRYTLLAALGLATYDQDDDGKGSVMPKEDRISEDQLLNLQALLAETGADESKFCVFLRIEELDELPAKQYNYAVKALEAKRGDR